MNFSHNHCELESISRCSPTNCVPIESKFYLKRTQDEICKKKLSAPHTFILIKAPRQFGKSSLLMRLRQEAKNLGLHIISVDFRGQFELKNLQDLGTLLNAICSIASDSLSVENNLEDFWKENSSSDIKQNTHNYFKYLLVNTTTSIVLMMDEINLLTGNQEVAFEFFSLLESWHRNSKESDVWERLKIVLAYSTEVYYKLENSLFNRSCKINLQDFTLQEIEFLRDLYNLNSIWQTGDTRKLYNLLGGHPYLIHKAIYEIADQKLTVSQFIDEALIKRYYADYLNTELIYLIEHSQKGEVFRDILDQKKIHRNKYLICENLRDIGLIKGNFPNYQSRNNLYTKFFMDKL